MKIVIRTKDVRLNRALYQWIEKQLSALEKFATIFEKEKYFDSFFGKGKPRTEIWVEVGRQTLHHRKGRVFRAEAQLRFPGQSLRAEAEDKYLKVAITTIKDELQQQIKQYKDKKIAKTKREARELKKTLSLTSAARVKKRKGGRERQEGV